MGDPSLGRDDSDGCSDGLCGLLKNIRLILLILWFCLF